MSTKEAVEKGIVCSGCGCWLYKGCTGPRFCQHCRDCVCRRAASSEQLPRSPGGPPLRPGRAVSHRDW